MRHLLVRKAVKTGEILVDLVTTTQTDFPGIAAAQMDEVESTLNNAQENAFAGTEEELLEGWKAALLAADYKGIMTGILHTRNDNVADTVTNEGTDVLYGQDFFYEELLGLRFKITPFSFFRQIPWVQRCYIRLPESLSEMHFQAEQTQILRNMVKLYLICIPELERSHRCFLR